jgi:hypothetical protein
MTGNGVYPNRCRPVEVKGKTIVTTTVRRVAVDKYFPSLLLRTRSAGANDEHNHGNYPGEVPNGKSSLNEDPSFIQSAVIDSTRSQPVPSRARSIERGLASILRPPASNRIRSAPSWEV